MIQCISNEALPGGIRRRARSRGAIQCGDEDRYRKSRTPRYNSASQNTGERQRSTQTGPVLRGSGNPPAPALPFGLLIDVTEKMEGFDAHVGTFQAAFQLIRAGLPGLAY
jgi:hypothetical protein